MSKNIQKLPAILQTVTEKKFFDATFDQVFSKKDSDYLNGFLGHRIPGKYDPIADFYLPEPSKNRTWWQLEPTSFTRNADTTKTNIFFYDDLLDNIKYYGGNTLNQDRLFSSEYYSWAPPIDFDMFVNYQNYYWVDLGFIPLEIHNTLYEDIVGKNEFIVAAIQENIAEGVEYRPEFSLTTGMHIILIDDPVHTGVFIVENIGVREYNVMSRLQGGFRLQEYVPNYLSGIEYLVWDGSITLANNRVITNTNWDILPWEVQTAPGNSDYITIERGASDNNSWSRTNSWVHIDAISASTKLNNIKSPVMTRAVRPIIQFSADLTLYKSGINHVSDIAYGFMNDINGNPFYSSTVDNMKVVDAEALLGVTLVNGYIVGFFNDGGSSGVWDVAPPGADEGHWDTSIYNSTQLWEITIYNDKVSLLPYAVVKEGDKVFISKDGPYGTDAAMSGETWYFGVDNGVLKWQRATNDKTQTNQPPLFVLYDHMGVPLDDVAKYYMSSFTGSPIFSYKINTSLDAMVDPILQFPIVYTSLGQATDIVFKNNLITDRYTYRTLNATTKTLIPVPINGYYYYSYSEIPVFHNSWELHTTDKIEPFIAPI